MNRNQMQGVARARGILPRRRVGRGRGRRGRGRGGRGRGDARPRGDPDVVPVPPHLSSRPLHIFLRFVYESMFIPSMLGFSLFWKTMKTRMEDGWGERVWSAYFFRQCMQQAQHRGQSLWTAGWHAGVVGRNEPGLPASQQTAEQAWRMLKRGLRASPLKTHVDLANRIERLASHWSRAPAAENHASRGTMSLLPVNRREISLTRPTGPHEWMLRDDGATVRRPGGMQQYLPSIGNILQKSRLRNGASVQRLQRGNRWFLCMSTGKPTAVPENLLQRMLDQVKARTEDELARLWLQEGFIEENDTRRINLTCYRSVTWPCYLQV